MFIPLQSHYLQCFIVANSHQLVQDFFHPLYYMCRSLVPAHVYHLAYQAEKAEASAAEKAAQVREMDGWVVVLSILPINLPLKKTNRT